MKHKLLIIVVMVLFSSILLPQINALSVVTHVPEKYVDVIAGERFYFEIQVKYPENPERKDLRLEYEILNSDGEIIAQSKVLKAVETQASFMDFIVIPESADPGMHFIKVKVSDYDDLNEEVEASFHVIEGTSSQIRLYFFILLGVIVLIGIVVSVEIYLMRKKK